MPFAAPVLEFIFSSVLFVAFFSGTSIRAQGLTNDHNAPQALGDVFEFRIYAPELQAAPDFPAWQTGVNIYGLRINRERIFEIRARLPRDDCAAPVLYFGLADQSFEAFVNGELIYASGDVGARAQGVTDWPRPFHLIPLPHSQSGPRELFLRFYSDSGHAGIIHEPPLLGCEAEFVKRIVREDAIRFGIGALSLLAVLISLGASIRANKIVAIRSFSFLCGCIGAFIVSNRTLRIQYIFYDSLPFWFAVETLATYLTPPAMILFVRSTIGRSWNIDLLFGVSVVIFAGIIGMNLLGFPAYRYIHIHYGLAFVCLLWLIVCALRAPAAGSYTSRFTFTGLLVFAATVSYDILGAVGILPWSHQTLSYGFFVMMLFLAAGTTRRNHAVEAQVRAYQHDLEVANRRLHESNASLEVRVRKRTEWLRNSLRKVTRLREQQESDYYLTARIMKPTRFRGLRLGRVSVTAYIEQNKKYRYNQWSGDIGGDVGMAHAMQFESGRWVCFMNGDAMGKSLQGAGGAIVLATSFQTILNRYGRTQQTKDPAQWLTNAYLELQEIFYPFEGKMNASLVMGLLHVENGRGLYINASHPAVVSLTGGEARYLSEEISAVIGTVEGIPEAALNEFQLNPGDVLLIGSDGRHDLNSRVASIEAARRISIVDQFPAIVAEAGGDLEKIVLRLEEIGELADDLWLLKIEYS